MRIFFLFLFFLYIPLKSSAERPQTHLRVFEESYLFLKLSSAVSVLSVNEGLGTRVSEAEEGESGSGLSLSFPKRGGFSPEVPVLF